jgi:enoyl-CoA hydratase/carnithine racemase
MVKVYEKRAPLSLAYAKRAVRAGMQMDLASGVEFERFLVTAIYNTADKNEGIGAFLEKREAKFSGR